ncbi:MAG: winged helix-turn-helix transcriptional regulator [Phycisphaerales bacterium]|nr:winged helix-turn-helix transcriptional regulator [Phycisphaerales bacterium]
MQKLDHNHRCELLGEFFRLFASAVRVKMFCCLKEGPLTVSQIASQVGIAMPNASQHLRIMRHLGAVRCAKVGNHSYYHLGDKRFMQAAELIAQVLEQRHAAQSRFASRRSAHG